ncbi:MAG: flagellar hook-associated protein FlgK [Epsilonproteobacteria bacterium]|nr:flagellar hook-associated protein FlgK [Campylobacterota bacterium]
MASIFSSLNIGYSGLNVAQNGINTTSHNISNAQTEGYTRQRVITSAATPVSSSAGNIGNGVEVTDIKRVFDNFIFDRYTDISAEKDYSDFEMKTLEELSAFFPEIDGVGIKSDLNAYYEAWQNFSDNPSNNAIKTVLAQSSKTLSEHIAHTQDQVKDLQSKLNDQLASNINEVNSLAEQLASINKSIDVAEAGDSYSANDLRDKRNVIERSLARLIGSQTNAGQIESNIQIDNSSNTKTGSYVLSVGGFNIVDGSTYHPIKLNNTDNQNGFYELSFQRQDGVEIPMSENIDGGVVGSILDLRGSSIDGESGSFKNGVVQNVISELDSFAKGIIESTNNIYAKSSSTVMESNTLNINSSSSIVYSGLDINEGSFNLIVYDLDGNEAAKREIDINVTTTMSGVAGSNSIQGQIEAQKDDNADANANNDIDDFINFNWADFAGGSSLEFSLDKVAESQGYTFVIEDNLQTDSFSSGTNFAGALGMNRFFDGDDAQSMQLNHKLSTNPTLISAGETAITGDNVIALDMVQHQYEKFDFDVNGENYNETTYAFFDVIATDVGTQTNAAILRNETISTQFNATELEYSSASQVDIDEEMTNLIKYQTAYGAAAKIITTIDQMMQTLLGIKQ